MAVLNVDYNEVVQMHLNVRTKTIERYDWRRLQASPLVVKDQNFDSAYAEQLFFAQHTLQVLSQEHYFNSILTPVSPIFISDGVFNEVTYLFVRGETFSTPTYLFRRDEAETPTYLFRRDELNEAGVDYVINLSNTDAALEPKLRSLALTLKPAGKQFEIKII